MSKTANTWIEGNGTVRTVFRTLAFWEYASPEICKLQLLNAVEKENVLPGPYLLQYVLNRRMREIQWVSVYAPMVAFLIISLFIIASILAFPGGHHLYMGFGLLAGLGIAFRLLSMNNTWKHGNFCHLQEMLFCMKYFRKNIRQMCLELKNRPL